MRTIDAMFKLRHGPLDVPLVLFVPELGVSLEVTSVRVADGGNYMAADGAICRGQVVVLEAVANAPAPDPLPDC